MKPIDPNIKPTDRYLKQLLQESYDGTTSRKILKLPCGCTSIELEKPQDVQGVCLVCMKPFYLVWSKINPQIKGVV